MFGLSTALQVEKKMEEGLGAGKIL